MSRVLVCTDWVDATQTCNAQAWIENGDSWLHVLPTVEQANEVGVAMFISLMTLAAFKHLTKPPKEISE